MAFNDYQYVGYTDEKIVTNLILNNLSRVMKARIDREKWLDSLAMQISQASDSIHVQGGNRLTSAEQRIEQQECDPVLKWLLDIEKGVLGRIKTLTPKEQLVIRESFLNAVHLSTAEISYKYDIKLSSVKSLKRTALLKLTGECIRAYRKFCLWRAYDDKELERRIKQTDEEIKKELKKKIGAA